MGLDNFLDEYTEDGEKKGSDRKYERLTQEQFEELLEAVEPGGFRVIGTEDDSNLAFTREIVYGYDLDDEEDDLWLRVYSTVDERTARARDKGKDAIRTVIWSDSIAQPIAGKTKTLRIKTWRENLAPKIRELLDTWDTRVIRCDECGAWMVRREPGQNDDWDPFYGCSKYPVCENNKSVGQVEEQFESLSPEQIKKEEQEVLEKVFGEE